MALQGRPSQSPAVVVLGPRRCGTSTLARHLLPEDAVSFDLQDRTDRAELADRAG